MTTNFTEVIEELTGRNVVAFLSQAHVDPVTIEIFFSGDPLPTCRALEIVAPE
jgi:hypothetical protein